MALSRRSFLRQTAGGIALAGAGGLLARRAMAGGGALATTLSDGSTYRVLEIFLNGGADLWAHAFRGGPWVNTITSSATGLASVTAAELGPLLTGANALWQPTPEETFPFGSIAGGPNVEWGPGMKPLWMSGLHTRTRMVCVGHNLPPHEGATPVALTGTSFGRTIASGLGAAINRTRAAGEAPTAFVLPVASGGISGQVLASASSAGFHGAQHRPPVIECGSDDIFTLLRRQDPTYDADDAPRAEGDPLRSRYANRYAELLTGAGGRVRSRGFDAYEGSLLTLHDHLGVQARLGAPGLTFVTPEPTTASQNEVATALGAAGKILGAGARHVLVIDRDWDMHPNASWATPAPYGLHVFDKVYRLTHAIATQVASGGIDLDNTLIYVHSEFARSGGAGTGGSSHHPYGYPVLLIGGPITTRRILGSLSEEDVPSADGAYGVTAVRAAVALAAGINPWHEDMYVESDEHLGDHILGYDELDDANVPVLETAILGM